MAKPTQLGTIAGMTGLIGVLPVLCTLWVAQRMPELSALGLTVIHLLVAGLGLLAFNEWFKR